MNELQQKLSKRRTYVEESGLKFESQPAAHESVMATPASPQRTCAALPKHSGVGVDFQAAISRRRATVDGDGETFESTPCLKTADVVSSPALSMSSPGFVPKSGSADFKKVIDQQRATVDGGAKTFESLPAERTADCVSSIRSETMQLPASALAEKYQAQESQDALTDADGSHGDVDPEDDVDDGDESDGGSPAHADQEPTKTILTVAGSRVSWLVGLSHPLATEYDSDHFALAGCEPVRLRLETLDGGCRLSLRVPEGIEEAMEVKLFVGKGWRKKAFRMVDSSSIVEDFGTDLTHRNSILCGVIFKGKVARKL